MLSSTVIQSMFTIKTLENKTKCKSNVIAKLRQEHKKCTLPINEKLLKTDKNCDFYTGIRSIKEFNVLHDIVSPFVKRRWRGVKKTSTSILRKYKSKPKSFGLQRKLSSKDEFLLMLMKLRLGLITGDLADRFGISNGLFSSIVTSWIKVTSVVLSPIIHIPDI